VAGTEETENNPRGKLGLDFRGPIDAMGESKKSQKEKERKKFTSIRKQM